MRQNGIQALWERFTGDRAVRFPVLLPYDSQFDS